VFTFGSRFAVRGSRGSGFGVRVDHVESAHGRQGISEIVHEQRPSDQWQALAKSLERQARELEQRSFTFGAMWNPAGTRQVLKGVVSGRPEIGRVSGHPNAERRTQNLEPRTSNLEPNVNTNRELRTWKREL